LNFLVDANGDVVQSVVENSSGHTRLDETARDALQRCKFNPAIQNGKPTFAWAPIEYVWSLRETATVIPQSCGVPAYPERERRQNVVGAVVIDFLIDKAGDIVLSLIEQSSGHRALDVAAREALEQCKFKPAIRNGMPISGWSRIKYVFNLK
jgi:TonB family protein